MILKPASLYWVMRVFFAAFIILAIIMALAMLGIGWHFSNLMLVPRPYSLEPEFEILAVTESSVTLPVANNPGQFADTRKSGVYNLLWEGGYGRLGATVADHGDRIVREFEVTGGEPPVAGTRARLDVAVYRRDPLSDHNLVFDDLKLAGPAGELRAWWVEGERDTAVLLLHGRRRSTLAETLRVLPALAEERLPVLALAYRNHDRSDMSPDGFYHYGASEWQDALTGLTFLRERGVERVVIFAYSMGAQVALELLKQLRASGDDRVKALILDSPMLDVRTVVRQGARNIGVPYADRLSDWALWVAGLRSGVDFGALDQVRSAPELDLPLLLIHGTADSTVPVGLSDEFAGRVTGPLEYRRLPEVDHVEAWNRHPDAYQRWVRSFLQEHVP